MANEKIQWIGRPEEKAHVFEHERPAAPHNPALRGLLLEGASRIFVYLPFLQSIFFSNAGFTKLRNRPELRLVHPRWEPTVIKSNGQPQPNMQDLLASLLKEDFSSRAPADKQSPSVLDYHEAYKSGTVTPSDVIEVLLPLIRRDIKEKTNHSVAFLDTRVELVRQVAEASTKRYKAGKPLSLLDGVPVAVKDEVDLAGYKRCCGSKLDFTNEEHVTSQCIVAWQDAGAVVIGKMNQHELGLDTTNLNPNYGTPLNPYNNDFYCGGSSGGSGYAVGTGLVPISHGADGGGSVRIPASWCGAYGLKPSHNRISGRPTPSSATTIGVHGPIAANMVDLELSYRLLARPDLEDATAAKFIAPVSTLQLKNRKKMLGIDRAWFNLADQPVRDACQRAVDWLVVNSGYEVVEITLPMLSEAQSAHAMSIVNEIASTVTDTSLLTAPNKVLIHTVRQATAIDIIQAQKTRMVLMEHLAYLYGRFSGLIIVSPTTPMAGWPIHPGDLTYGTSDGNTSVRSMIYSFVANWTGNPAITAPVGYAEHKGGPHPIGFMGMGDWCSEDELLAFGYDCERYLHEGVEGGRQLPKNWVNALEKAKTAAA